MEAKSKDDEFKKFLDSLIFSGWEYALLLSQTVAFSSSSSKIE